VVAARTRAYGIVTLEPRLFRASIGSPAVTDACSDDPFEAAPIVPPMFGTVPGVKDPAVAHRHPPKRKCKTGCSNLCSLQCTDAR